MILADHVNDPSDNDDISTNPYQQIIKDLDSLVTKLGDDLDLMIVDKRTVAIHKEQLKTIAGLTKDLYKSLPEQKVQRVRMFYEYKIQLGKRWG